MNWCSYKIDYGNTKLVYGYAYGLLLVMKCYYSIQVNVISYPILISYIMSYLTQVPMM